MIGIDGLIFDFSICFQEALGGYIAIEGFFNRSRGRICDGGRFQKACVLLWAVGTEVVVSRHDDVLHPVKRLEQIYAVSVMKVGIASKCVER